MAALALELDPHEIRRIAAETFVFGYPLVLVDMVRRAHPVGPNQILMLPDDAADVAPGLRDGDPRMLQSSAWIDLSTEPMIVSLPPVDGRHLTVTLIDAWGESIPCVGPRSPPVNGHGLAIVGPQWHGELSPDLTARRAPTNAVWMVTRLAAETVGDRELTRTLLGRQRIRPPNRTEHVADPEPLMLEPLPKASIDAVAALAPEVFLHRLAALLGRHSHQRFARDEFETIGRIGVIPGKPYAQPSTETKDYQAIVRGLADGLAKIKQAASPALKAGAWTRLYEHPPPHDHLSRASATYSGLGAPTPESILNLVCETDSEGQPLLGSERYELHFRPGQAPPVDHFWSLALYHRPPHGQLLLHRRALGDRDRLRMEPGGALHLLIQHAPPSSGKVSNWLPCPLGQFSLVLRLHGPKSSALKGVWSPPPVLKVNHQAPASG